MDVEAFLRACRRKLSYFFPLLERTPKRRYYFFDAQLFEHMFRNENTVPLAVTICSFLFSCFPQSTKEKLFQEERQEEGMFFPVSRSPSERSRTCCLVCSKKRTQITNSAACSNCCSAQVLRKRTFLTEPSPSSSSPSNRKSFVGYPRPRARLKSKSSLRRV